MGSHRLAQRARVATCAVLLLALALALVGCGGKTTVGGGPAGAGGTAGSGGATGSGGGSPVDAGPDGPAPPFACQGDVAMVELGSQVIAPVAVTTMELPLLSCCQVNGVRFHTKETLGFDVVVVLRAWGMFEMGEHDVADPNSLIDAYVLDGPVSELPWPEQAVVGTVEVLDAYGGDQPWHAGLCLRLDEPGSELGGIRLYVPSAVVMPFAWWQRWGIWLLADPAMDAVAAAQVPLTSLALQPSAALALGDIAYYESGAHTVGFGDIEGLVPALAQQLPPVGVNGVPFVVVVDDERIYLGAFMTQLSSVMFNGPAVMIEEMDDRGFAIGAPPPGTDPRGDPRIIQVMREAGKLVP